ncbi:MAG: lamin tail domain-containing protein [Bacteroidia bacterium]|nr:lamin tail domain-containing protein [Bacteroidia bacterium]
MRTICVIIFLIHFNFLFAQSFENFNDSNFNKNPFWYGDTSKFILISGRLRSNSSIANDKFFISTKSKLVNNTVFEFYINLQFNTSSLNYTDIFLSSDSSNLNGQNSGYFVRLGGTNDEICLYKKIKNVSAILIDGKNGVLNKSNNIFKIKVICDSNYNFSLFRDSTATGNNYVLEGKTINNELTTSEFAGILIKQSTSSFFKLHYFDDIIISKIFKDTILPYIKRVESVSTDTFRIYCSEKMKHSSLDLSNFNINKGIGSPISAIFYDTDSSIIEIVFGKKINYNIVYELNILNCIDYSGLKLKDTIFNIKINKFDIPEKYELLISEIMPDPDPVVGLPNAEYVEIYNNSSNIITLYKCRIHDKSSSIIFPDIQIFPDSFLIICDKSNENYFKKYGTTLGVSNFISLNNTGDEIVLRNSNGNLIHRLIYNENDFKDNFKSNGGWSLEMIDKTNPCNSSNYIFSISNDGGTPGKTNSVSGKNSDISKPELIDIFIKTDSSVILVFNETLDSFVAANSNNYSIINNSISAVKINLNEIEIKFSDKIKEIEKTEIKVKNISDCNGNTIPDTAVNFSFPYLPQNGNLLINEILFNPKNNGCDYVEIYNITDKFISLKNLYLFNFNSNNLPDNFSITDTSGRFILPYSYKVFSISSQWVLSNYKFCNKESLVQLNSIPAMNDDMGHIGISDKWNNIIDEFDYKETMHYELLSETEGVSLEKINCKTSSEEISNWTSAAASYGFGTPGMINSHNVKNEGNNDFLSISPEYFSPDEDGTDDIISFTISNSKPNSQATLKIFDINGLEIIKLANNIPIGANQTWYWNGIDYKMKRTPIGIYIVYAEMMGDDGKLKVVKKTFTLGRK